jgi:hypothetical protein
MNEPKLIQLAIKESLYRTFVKFLHKPLVLTLILLS